jgi:hypothetical protein
MNEFGTLFVCAVIVLGVLILFEIGAVSLSRAFLSDGFFMPGIYLSVGLLTLGAGFYGSFYVVKSCYQMLVA